MCTLPFRTTEYLPVIYKMEVLLYQVGELWLAHKIYIVEVRFFFLNTFLFLWRWITTPIIERSLTIFQHCTSLGYFIMILKMTNITKTITFLKIIIKKNFPKITEDNELGLLYLITQIHTLNILQQLFLKPLKVFFVAFPLSLLSNGIILN